MQEHFPHIVSDTVYFTQFSWANAYRCGPRSGLGWHARSRPTLVNTDRFCMIFLILTRWVPVWYLTKVLDAVFYFSAPEECNEGCHPSCMWRTWTIFSCMVQNYIL